MPGDPGATRDCIKPVNSGEPGDSGDPGEAAAVSNIGEEQPANCVNFLDSVIVEGVWVVVFDGVPWFSRLIGGARIVVMVRRPSLVGVAWVSKIIEGA